MSIFLSLSRFVERRFSCCLVGVVCALFSFGCFAGSAEQSLPASPSIVSAVIEPGPASLEPKIRVLTSIYPLALIVNELAGDLVEVQSLLDASADPHHFSLRVSDLKRVNDADILVWIGPEFERFLVKLLAAKPNLSQSALHDLEGLVWPGASEHDHAHHAGHEHDHHDGKDLHLWLNPENAKLIAAEVVSQLVALRPALKQPLAERLMRFQAQTDRLQAQLRASLRLLSPLEIGVDHNGFGHLFHAYGITQVAAVSQSKSERLSVKRVMNLSKDLGSARCLLVGYGEGSSSKLGQLFSIKTVEVDTLGRNPDITSYSELMSRIGQRLVRCLTPT